MIEQTLLYIIKCYLNDKKIENISFDEKKLFILSNSLNVSTIVAYELMINNYKSILFEKCIYKSICNLEKFNMIINDINDKFTDVKYLYVKGYTIAKFYKKPYLRYSSDIDIVVDNIDYENAFNILTNNMHFKLMKNAISEVSLVNKQGVNIDFHRTFLYDKPKYEKIFDSINYTEHELDNNYKYIYHIVHGAIHFVKGQLDLRFFIDLFYLRDSIDDINVVNARLFDLDLSSFNKVMNSYLDSLLGKKEYCELDNKITNYIFAYACDEGAKNRANNSKDFFGLINHIFPPFRIMAGKYPILKRHILLLPLYYLMRIIEVLNSSRRTFAIKEINEFFKRDDCSKIVEELGISNYLN